MKAIRVFKSLIVFFPLYVLLIRPNYLSLLLVSSLYTALAFVFSLLVDIKINIEMNWQYSLFGFMLGLLFYNGYFAAWIPSSKLSFIASILHTSADFFLIISWVIFTIWLVYSINKLFLALCREISFSSPLTTTILFIASMALFVFNFFNFREVNYYTIIANYSVIKNGYSNNTIVNLSNPDNASYFDPTILELPNGTYRMYVSDRGLGGIISFDSDNLVEWKDKQISHLPDNNDTWNSTINRSTVCLINDQYVMYYTGQNNGKSSIGIATSNDGISFVPYSAEPVLIPEYKWEKDSVMNPYVIYIEEQQCYYMYYAAGDTYEPNVIATAFSADGFTWEKTGEIVLSKRSFLCLDCNRVGACEVYKHNGIYYMYYIGYSDIDTARICLASSKDGINWNRSFLNSLIAPSDDSNSDACYKPTVLYFDNDILVFYNGRNKSFERICCTSCNFD